MPGWRFAIFITLVLTVWALWLTHILARLLNARNLEVIVVPLEFAAAVWMGTLFLLFAALLVVDLLTAGGIAVLRNRAAAAIRRGFRRGDVIRDRSRARIASARDPGFRDSDAGSAAGT